MKRQFKQKLFHSPDAYDIDSIWQLLYPEHFINVLLIHHMKRREEDIEEVAGMMRDGLMGYCDSKSIKFTSLFTSLYDQFHHKNFKSIKISDIFEPFQDKDDSIIEPKYILIDGAPGMGKTTLCKEIAYQWANGSY